MCSLLCICYEVLNVLNGDPSHAREHLEYSLEIVQQKPVDDDLLQAFTRLDIQASSYIGVRMPRIVLNSDPQIPSVFQNLKEAEKAFRLEHVQMYRFIRSTADQYRHYTPCPIPLEVLARAQELQRILSKWHAAFTSSLQQSTILLTSTTATQIYILQTHHIAATIQISNSLYAEESIYDSFDSEFARMNSLAEKLLSNHSLESKETGYETSFAAETFFSVDVGIVHPLYLAATKCHHLPTRERAISLLHRVPRQEGIWNGVLMAKVAERVKQVEEEGFGEFRIDGGQRVPGWQRVHGIIRGIRETEKSMVIGCRRMLNGNDGGWDEKNEVIRW
jgi:hypothetical protein